MSRRAHVSPPTELPYRELSVTIVSFMFPSLVNASSTACTTVTPQPIATNNGLPAYARITTGFVTPAYITVCRRMVREYLFATVKYCRHINTSRVNTELAGRTAAHQSHAPRIGRHLPREPVIFIVSPAILVAKHAGLFTCREPSKRHADAISPKLLALLRHCHAPLPLSHRRRHCHAATPIHFRASCSVSREPRRYAHVVIAIMPRFTSPSSEYGCRHAARPSIRHRATPDTLPWRHYATPLKGDAEYHQTLKKYRRPRQASPIRQYCHYAVDNDAVH